MHIDIISSHQNIRYEKSIGNRKEANTIRSGDHHKLTAFTWKMMQEDLAGWRNYKEWPDEYLQKIAQEIRNTNNNHTHVDVRKSTHIQLIKEFLPKPIKEALD